MRTNPWTRANPWTIDYEQVFRVWLPDGRRVLIEATSEEEAIELVHDQTGHPVEELEAELV